MPRAVPLFTLQFVLEDTHTRRNDKNQLPEFWGERREMLLGVYFSIGFIIS